MISEPGHPGSTGNQLYFVMTTSDIHPASFRDPAGHLFYENGRLLRQVNTVYRDDYDVLMHSGLYHELVDRGYLVAHHEVKDFPGDSRTIHKVIAPEMLGFISYPYEWCFSQYRDAALLTLRIQKLALQYGMSLKDASAYNVQFHRGRPIFIDTLSFGRHREGAPWSAYRQFVQHFLAPLALMRYTDTGLNHLMQIHLDGVPLALASRLLPMKTRFRLSILMHIHMHAKAQKRYSNPARSPGPSYLSGKKLMALTEDLTHAVRSLRMPEKATTWGAYYSFTNYSERSFAHKKKIVAGFIDRVHPANVWDLGANTGVFTDIAAQNAAAQCIAFDSDVLAVDLYYRRLKKDKVFNVLPLVADITSPSPAIGWENRERMALTERSLPDMVMALALIHHLAIANNLPLANIAAFFSGLGKHLIVEFVPKEDSQVQKLLASRDDIFPGYTEEGFRSAFGQFFRIVESRKIEGSVRTLFRMERKD